MYKFVFNKAKDSIGQIRFLRLLKYKFDSAYDNYSVFDDLNENSLFIDLGANIGRVSEYVSDISGGCQIHCYEPHPSAFSYLKNRFKNFSNINLSKFAVSDSNSKKTMYLNKKSGKGFDIKYSQATSLEINKVNISKELSFEVQTIHIMKILDSFEKIDCIKIDIEGHEYKILPFLIDNREKIGKVICELHGNKNPITNVVSNPFLRENYKATVQNLKNKNLYGNWLVEWH